MARCIIEEPNYLGVCNALDALSGLMGERAAGFTDIAIDHKSELKDAICLKDYDSPDQGFAGITRKRTVLRPNPYAKTLSNVHKAKGLECENSLLMHCSHDQYGDTLYGRCKLYVALSRAKSSLTLVIPPNETSRLFRL